MEQNIIVKPGHLQGQVQPPLSKSLLHRSLICAALAGDLRLADLGTDTLSDDITTTRECLIAIMETMEKDQKEGGVLHLSCKESGSTLRFLVPLLAALGISAQLVGEKRLPQRPLGEYAEIFEKQDIQLDFPGDGLYLPLSLKGQLKSGVFQVPGHISSQYITGLLLVLPLLEGDSHIVLTSPLESEPYVEMTRDVMRAFGVSVDKVANGYFIPGGQVYHRDTPYRAEPDFSQAAFWLVANYLGNQITLPNLPVQSSQGDQEIVQLLKIFRSIRALDEEGSPQDEQTEVEIDVSQIPDLVPILSVAAAATPCVTQIIHGERLRLKECDRLMATHAMLMNLGADIKETQDGLIICGRKPENNSPVFKSCTVESFHDHRMVMAAAIAATRADGPVTITFYRSADKSYPEFFRDFSNVGGNCS